MDQQSKDTKAAAEHLLRGQSTLVLSTVNSDGTPYATPLFYLLGDELELYWFSSASSQHSQNLSHGGAVSAAVYVATERWREICGVQVKGTAEKITDRKVRREITRRYCERFHLGQVFRLAFARSSLYVFRPSWLRYIDNSKRFGFRSEVSLPATPGENPVRTS
jgi:uncharacterized protein YhbP (UPF0306 family)